MKIKTTYKTENIKHKKVIKEENLVNYSFIIFIFFSIISIFLTYITFDMNFDFYGNSNISIWWLFSLFIYSFYIVFAMLLISFYSTSNNYKFNLIIYFLTIITIFIIIFNFINSNSYLTNEIQKNIYIEKHNFIPTNLNSKYILPDTNELEYCYNLELLNKETWNLEYFKLKCVRESEFKWTETLKEIVKLKREKIKEIIWEGNKSVSYTT